MDLLDPRSLARYAGALGLGLVVGVVGTAVHRWSVPWGLVLALVMVVVVGVLARAWAGGGAVLAAGLGVMTAVGVLGTLGPGGDVLVAAQPVGVVWYCGGLAVAVAAVLPARWFSDRPIAPQVPARNGVGGP